VTWTIEAASPHRKRLWKRHQCLVERRKPPEWRPRQAGRRDQAHGVRRPWDELNPESVFPRPPSAILRQELEFEQLADRWEAETALESVVTRKAMHAAYQRIIGMGNTAVPWILARLQRAPGQWFWALTAITGEDPAYGQETVQGASMAWIQWGRTHGLLGD